MLNPIQAAKKSPQLALHQASPQSEILLPHAVLYLRLLHPDLIILPRLRQGFHIGGDTRKLHGGVQTDRDSLNIFQELKRKNICSTSRYGSVPRALFCILIASIILGELANMIIVFNCNDLTKRERYLGVPLIILFPAWLQFRIKRQVLITIICSSHYYYSKASCFTS